MNKEAILVALKNHIRVTATTQGYPLQLLNSNILPIQIAAGMYYVDHTPT